MKKLPELDIVDVDTDLCKFMDNYGDVRKRAELKRHFLPRECTALARIFYFDWDNKRPQTIRSLAERDLVGEMKKRKNFGKVTVATLHEICTRFGLPIKYPLPVSKQRHCKTCTCHLEAP